MQKVARNMRSCQNFAEQPVESPNGKPLKEYRSERWFRIFEVGIGGVLATLTVWLNYPEFF